MSLEMHMSQVPVAQPHGSDRNLQGVSDGSNFGLWQLELEVGAQAIFPGGCGSCQVIFLSGSVSSGIYPKGIVTSPELLMWSLR